MFNFPKTLHQFRLFEEDGVFYAAGIEKARGGGLSIVMADILKLAETQINEEIVQTLKVSYVADDILEAFERVDFGRLSRSINETCFGILTLHRDHETWLLPLYQRKELPPILVQCHAPGGHGGNAINSMLQHYAAMRDYDAFTAPSDYVHECYAEYVWDTRFFNPSNGVDSVLLSPMDKKAAKKELAERVGDDRITTVPTVSVTSYSPRK